MFSFKKIWKKLRRRISPFRFIEIAIKFDEIEKQKDKIQTLVIGSSHAAQGFNPSVYSCPNAFNLASVNMDLYTAHQLVSHYLPQMPKLKKLIVFYSVFSVGHELDKGNDTAICSILNHFYHISYPNHDIKRWQRSLNHRIKKYEKQQLIPGNKGNGYFPREIPNVMLASERVQHHLKENHRPTDQTYLLDKIFLLCQQYKVQLEVVIPPCRSDYTALITEPTKSLFKSLFSLQNKRHFYIFNFWKSGAFIDRDFFDPDHLTQVGAVKLTQLLNKHS